jgi:hypothetical protein
MLRTAIIAFASFFIGMILTLFLAQKAAERRDEVMVSLVHAKESVKANQAIQQGSLLEAYAYESAALRSVRKEDSLFPSGEVGWELWLPLASLILEPFQANRVTASENLNRLESASLVRFQKISNELSGRRCSAKSVSQ